MEGVVGVEVLVLGVVGGVVEEDVVGPPVADVVEVDAPLEGVGV